MGGTFSAQLIALCAVPLLTRLFAPEEFGRFTLFTSAYALLCTVISSKLDLAIILPKSDDGAYRLNRAALELSVVGGGVFVLLWYWVPWQGVSDYVQYPWLLLVACIIGVGYSCQQQWSGRENCFRRYGKAQVVGALANVTGCFVVGWIYDFTSEGLILGFILGILISWGYLAGRKSRIFVENLLKVDSDRLKLLRDYKNFPLQVMPSSLFATLGVSLMPFLLKNAFSLELVGMYAIANRMLQVPAALMGRALNESFRSEFVRKLKAGEDVKTLFLTTLRNLMAFSIPVFLGAYYILPPLAAYILGEKFSGVSRVMEPIVLSSFAQFVSLPFHYVFIATGRTGIGMLALLVLSAAPLTGVYLASQSFDIYMSIQIGSVAWLVAAFVLISLAFFSVLSPKYVE